jgi:hypothetical protein
MVTPEPGVMVFPETLKVPSPPVQPPLARGLPFSWRTFEDP